MSWPSDVPFYNFNEFSILLNAKAEYGVYAVFDAERNPILIDAGDIMVDLVRLAEGGDHQFRRARPATFSYIVASFEEAQAMKRYYAHELQVQGRTAPKMKAKSAAAS